MSKNQYAIDARGIQKSFGKVKVLTGIDLRVEKGTIMALLGPNGAGKTTTIRILSTLLPYDSGQATINGHDVAKDPDGVRGSIGLTGQFAAVDEYLTGVENLEMMGRLYRLSRNDARRRSNELLKIVDLVEASKRPVRTYSGGMKRRLDLAMSLIAGPPIIFLDEPTTGLDPRSRMAMWSLIKELAKSGTTILLTTQYMEEADQLADQVIVIDGGKVIAKGTPSDLKSDVGADRLEIVIGQKSSFKKAQDVIRDDSLQTDEENRTLSVASKGGVKTLKEVLQRLESAKINVESISLHRPTLDDVFLNLTGHAATQAEDAEAGQKTKGKK
ncbi:MAG TPA: ATP-binding cassette domain-containing protein [Nitrososphaera sp.]|nr:ATP-binding cassette domain-containing protein [Nitrososphaera sp.]